MGRGLHILGSATVHRDASDAVRYIVEVDSWKSIAAGAVGGAVALSFADKHPVLLALDGYELGSTAMDLHTGAIDKAEAARRIGRVAIATAATLFLPIPGLLAWIAGALAANLLIPVPEKDLDSRAYADATIERMRELAARAKDEAVALVKHGEEAIS